MIIMKGTASPDPQPEANRMMSMFRILTLTALTTLLLVGEIGRAHV